jgi:CBS domain containing-hemolysin-like protein
MALLALSGTFSGSETALFSLDRLQLRRLERSRSRSARLVAAAIDHPERLLAGILFGNTLVNVACSSVMLAIARRLEEPLGLGDPVGASVIAATCVVLVFGEILPKGLAVHWPVRVSLVLVPLLSPLLRIMAPVSRVLESVALAFLKAVGVRGGAAAGMGWRELQVLFEDIKEGEEFSEDEGEMASNIFDFFQTRAYEVLTPRVDVVALDAGTPPQAIRARMIEAQHSRYPVYRDDLDHIIGFVDAKAFLLDADPRLETMLHPVHFVPERARLHRILAEVQARQLSLVVVVNEYGGTAGIITQEDLVEEVVGEIFDEQERDHTPELETLGEGRWRAAGLLSLQDLAEAVGVPPAESPAVTVAGHVAHLLGRLPRIGDTVEDVRVRYEVLQVKRHRAQRVLVSLRPPAVEEGGAS